MGAEAATFRSKQEIVFGVGAEERVLEERNWPFFLQLLTAIRDTRHPYGSRQHPLFRLRPERWLESLVAADVSVIDERLDPRSLYSQVPAFSASDRAMLDVLTTTHDGRLAVLELKADEDIHLPLQGLDYWSRVEWHHSRGEFPRFGYFRGVNCRSKSRCCTWWRPLCTYIPRPTSCCVTFPPRSSGSSLALTSAGARE
jgi:hypothetical protein